MRIEVDLEKKWAVGIIFSVLILAGVIGIYAGNIVLGEVPNPGHALNNIQGYFENDLSLEDSLGKLCQTDGSNCDVGGGSGYHIEYNNYEDIVSIEMDFQGDDATVNCPEGKVVHEIYASSDYQLAIHSISNVSVGMSKWGGSGCGLGCTFTVTCVNETIVSN